MSRFVKSCEEDTSQYLQAIISTCGVRLVERIAEDYGLSQKELLDRYSLQPSPSGSHWNGFSNRKEEGSTKRLSLNTERSPSSSSPRRLSPTSKAKPKPNGSQVGKITTYTTIDKVLEGTDSLLADMQVLDVASDDLLHKHLKDEAGKERNVGETLKKVLLETDRKIVDMANHIKYLANTLHSVFPPKVVEALKSELNDIADLHPSVSVLMSDIVGFTAWCADAPPTQVIEDLSAYFQVIDDLAEQIGVYKVETIGDGYQAICGHNNEEDHSERMATFGLAIIDTIPQMRRIFNNESFSVRVGINSGPIVTGVIRADRPRWQLFGDTVNYASRMESTSEPGKVQVSRSTYDLLNMVQKFHMERRGLIRVKGKGDQETFWLRSRRRESATERHPNIASYKPLNEKPDQNSMGKPTALIVDDMLSIILQLSRTLKKAGVHVVTARNGKEAYEILQEQAFDVVLCDIHMPVMTGLEFVKKFREWEKENRSFRQKVFALTGTMREDEPLETFIAAGFDSLMNKTIPKNELLALVVEDK